jgi:hypothetical protein
VGRPDIVALRQRHDAYRGTPAPNLTLRALAIPLDELAGLAEVEGRLLVFGGEPAPSGAWLHETDVALPQSQVHVFRRRRFT